MVDWDYPDDADSIVWPMRVLESHVDNDCLDVRSVRPSDFELGEAGLRTRFGEKPAESPPGVAPSSFCSTE